MVHTHVKRKKKRVKGVKYPRLRSTKYSLKHAVGKRLVKSGDKLIEKGHIDKGIARRHRGLEIGSPKTRREKYNEEKKRLRDGYLDNASGRFIPDTGVIFIEKKDMDAAKSLKRDIRVLTNDIRLIELELKNPHLKATEIDRWMKELTKNRLELKKDIGELKKTMGEIKDTVEHERGHKKDTILFGFKESKGLETLFNREISAHIQSNGKIDSKLIEASIKNGLKKYEEALPEAKYKQIEDNALLKLKEKLNEVNEMQKKGASVYEIRKMLLKKGV